MFTSPEAAAASQSGAEHAEGGVGCDAGVEEVLAWSRSARLLCIHVCQSWGTGMEGSRERRRRKGGEEKEERGREGEEKGGGGREERERERERGREGGREGGGGMVGGKEEGRAEGGSLLPLQRL